MNYRLSYSLLIPPQVYILRSDALGWIPNTRLTKVHILLKSWGEAGVILQHQKQELEFCATSRVWPPQLQQYASCYQELCMDEPFVLAD